MSEHDDDLESKVYEGAQQETESYPSTGDELDDRTRDTLLNERADDVLAEDDEDPTLDNDETEL